MTTGPNPFHQHVALGFLLVFLLWFVALAMAPWYRQDWLLENVLVLVAVPVLVKSYRRFPLSLISYGLILVFLLLHEIGAHYTYAEVPWWHWIGWVEPQTRNHFDRWVHFLFGLLLTYPCREYVVRIAEVRGFWAYSVPLLAMVSFSTLFEFIEWFAANLFGGDLGVAYLGTQGDVWDAQKDMALASAGALTATLLIGGIHRALARDFAREWAESLRVKQPEPLGEVAITRLLAARRDQNTPSPGHNAPNNDLSG